MLILNLKKNRFYKIFEKESTYKIFKKKRKNTKNLTVTKIYQAFEGLK